MIPNKGFIVITLINVYCATFNKTINVLSSLFIICRKKTALHQMQGGV